MTVSQSPDLQRRPSVLVAMDAFKGSLSAVEACAAAERGIRRALPGVEVRRVPLADGGEGTAATIFQASGGKWIRCRAPGPLLRGRVEGRVGWLPDAGPRALVEMAQVNGLALVESGDRDPERSSTRGTGVLVAAAADRGARSIWLAIGGSATVDGGTGAARALGWRFLDVDGADVPEGGGVLQRIRRIVPPAADPLEGVAVRVLRDVDNPLLGPRGAARVFGPQKGATPAQVERLEAGLAHLADRIEAELGLDLRTIPGGGAAGGLGAGATAFMKAELVPGVEAVMEAVGLDEALSRADLVITGEGAFDEQSFHGKVVSGVVGRAREYGVPVTVVAGAVRLSEDEARAGGVTATESAAPPGMPLEEAMTRAAELVEAAAGRLALRVLPPP